MRIVHRLTLAEKVTLAFIMGVVYLAVVGTVAYSSVFRFANGTERATLMVAAAE
jgi:CHASE3 domain sensor protein